MLFMFQMDIQNIRKDGAMYKYFYDMYETTMKGTREQTILQPIDNILNQANVTSNYLVDVFSYMNDFTIPFFAASKYFNDVEKKKLAETPPIESFFAYIELFDANFDLFTRSMMSTIKAMGNYGSRELKESLNAWFNTFFQKSD